MPATQPTPSPDAAMKVLRAGGTPTDAEWDAMAPLPKISAQQQADELEAFNDTHPNWDPNNVHGYQPSVSNPTALEEAASYPLSVATGIASGMKNITNLGINYVANPVLHKLGIQSSIPNVATLNINKAVRLPTHPFVSSVASYIPSMIMGGPEMGLAKGALEGAGMETAAKVASSPGAIEAARSATYGGTTAHHDKGQSALEMAALSTFSPMLAKVASSAVSAPFNALAGLKKSVASNIIAPTTQRAVNSLQDSYNTVKNAANNWDNVTDAAKQADTELGSKGFKPVAPMTGVTSSTYDNSYIKNLEGIKSNLATQDAPKALLSAVQDRINRAPNNFSDAIGEKQAINQIPSNWSVLQKPEIRMAQRTAGKMGDALDTFIASKATTPKAQNFVSEWGSQRKLYGQLQSFYQKPTPKGGFSTPMYNDLESGNFEHYLTNFLPKEAQSELNNNGYKQGAYNALVNDATSSQDFNDLARAHEISKMKGVQKSSPFARKLIASLAIGSALHESVGGPLSFLGGLSVYKGFPQMEKSFVKNLSEKYAEPGMASSLQNLGKTPKFIKGGAIPSATPYINAALIPQVQSASQ